MGSGTGLKKKGQDLNRTQQIKNERNHYRSFAPHGIHIPHHTTPHHTTSYYTIPYDTI